MKPLFYLFFVIIIPFSNKAQDNYIYNVDNYSFVGNFDNQLIYINWQDQEKLFTPDLDRNLVVKWFKEINLKGAKTIWFVNDIVRVDHSLKDRITTITYKGEIKEILNGYRLSNILAYSHEKNMIIIAYKVATTSMLALYDLSSGTTEFLSLIGKRPIFSNGYLYFSADHICELYSAYIDDIYRVKVGDWNNPELILQNTEPSWAVLPNSNIIYADILEDRAKRILFNADTKTYAITDYAGSSTIINYKGEHYYQMKQYDQPISFKKVKFAENYPNKDERVLCPIEKKKVINLSNVEKSFSNTFITEELLYNSTNKELSELNKEELRILGNAFYARQGYQFNSKDLQDFFGQFDWYHKMVERNKFFEITNEEVVISPKDKERVELILKIESSK